MNAIYVVHYATTNPALDFTTTNIGGAINASVEITGLTPNQLLFSMDSLPTGLGSLTQNNKSHLKNTHADTPAQQVKIWLENGGIPLPSFGQPTAYSTSALDTTTYKLRFLGYAFNGDSLATEKTLNGVSQVTCNDVMLKLHRVELRDNLGALIAANGTIFIYLGVTLIGIIPAGMSTMTCEIRLAMTLSQNESGTNGSGNSAAIAPSTGVASYSRPVTEATALTIPGTSLDPGDNFGLWHELVVEERAQSSSAVEVSIAKLVRA